MGFEELIARVAAVSVPYLVLLAVVAWLARPLEVKFVLLGLLTAVAGIAYGSLLGPSVHAGQVGVTLGGGELAGVLMRIGLILVLAGLAVALCARCGAAIPGAQE